MDPAHSGYWVAIALPAVATFLGVLLAFWLDRIAERRRQDTAAFWAARHFTRRIARSRTEKPHLSLLRALADDSEPSTQQAVYRQLDEVYPPLAWAWWVALEDMHRTHERRGIFKIPENVAFKDRANRIDLAFEQAGRAWPTRGRRLATLMDALGVKKVK